MAEGHEHHDRRYAFTVEQRDLRLVLRDDRQERRRTSTTRWSPPAARSLFQAAAAWQAPCGCGWSVGALGCSPRPASWCGGGGPVVAAGGGGVVRWRGDVVGGGQQVAGQAEGGGRGGGAGSGQRREQG